MWNSPLVWRPAFELGNVAAIPLILRRSQTSNIPDSPLRALPRRAVWTAHVTMTITHAQEEASTGSLVHAPPAVEGQAGQRSHILGPWGAGSFRNAARSLAWYRWDPTISSGALLGSTLVSASTITHEYKGLARRSRG